MLRLLEALLKASPKVKSFQIIANDPIDYGNFLLKVHCELTFGRTFQIRFRAVAGHTFLLLLRIYTDKPLLTALGQRHLFFQSHELSAPLPQ